MRCRSVLTLPRCVTRTQDVHLEDDDLGRVAERGIAALAPTNLASVPPLVYQLLLLSGRPGSWPAPKLSPAAPTPALRHSSLPHSHGRSLSLAGAARGA